MHLTNVNSNVTYEMNYYVLIVVYMAVLNAISQGNSHCMRKRVVSIVLCGFESWFQLKMRAGSEGQLN